MEVEISSRSPRSGLAFEERCAAIERFLIRHKVAVIVLLSLMYFVGTSFRANGKPFWCDEILTILEARQPSLSASMQAGRDWDWMPPLSFVPPYLVNRLAGTGRVVFRLPAMIGFWVFCLCLFGFAARRVNIFFALVALLLPFATIFEPYSFEARPYGMILGFFGIALFCWQTAAAGRKRAISIAGLTLGIACALLNHYYAIMIYLPLAGAEIFRSLRQRKVDWPIWAAFIAAGLPMLGSLLAAMHVMKNNTHPWVQAHARDYLLFYTSAFSYSLAFVVPVVVLCTAVLVLGADKEQASTRRPSIPDYELLSAALILLVPVGAITLALVVPPHIFVDRYAIVAIGGFALLTSFLGAHFAGGRSAIGVVFLLGALLPFMFDLTKARPFKNPLYQEPVLVRALQNGPVIVNNEMRHWQFWYYAPEELRPNLIYLLDEAAAMEYFHVDDHAGAFRGLGMRIVDYNTFATPGKSFLLYFTGSLDWVPEKVLHDGGTMSVVEWNQGNALLRARLK